jgi:hypothetical protein
VGSCSAGRGEGFGHGRPCAIFLAWDLGGGIAHRYQDERPVPTVFQWRTLDRYALIIPLTAIEVLSIDIDLLIAETIAFVRFKCFPIRSRCMT